MRFLFLFLALLCGVCVWNAAYFYLRQPQENENTGIVIIETREEKEESESHTQEMNHDTNNITSSFFTKQTKYWRYDQASPPILAAKTLFLQSIPIHHRLSVNLFKDISLSTNNTIHNGTSHKANDFLKVYASQPQHQWPQKLHLYEMNPCIAILPLKYRRSLVHATTGDGNGIPTYIVVHRVTHMANCYDGTISLQLFGGTWNPTTTDYLGVSLLDDQLNIVHETVVDVKSLPKGNDKLPLIYPNDYRIYNFESDQQHKNHHPLYLTSLNRIVPIHLTLNDGKRNIHDPKSNCTTSSQESWIEIPQAFAQVTPFSSTSSSTSPLLRVWVRKFSACPVYYHPRHFTRKSTSKNLLYFVSNDNTHDKNDHHVRVVHYPRQNPNDVRHVQLDIPCGKQRITPYDDKPPKPLYPSPSFSTVEELLFPWTANGRSSSLFLNDRGSACCTCILHPITQQQLLVALVHPKTHFPGKKLPKGVIPNTYLSRWIAFEPQAPYTIVARSGMFCFGYPDSSEWKDDHVPNTTNDIINHSGNSTKATISYQNPFLYGSMPPLTMRGEKFNCPRIHFVMGMVDKVDDPSKVLISYGVSDCLSRIVQVSKSDIQARIWPINERR